MKKTNYFILAKSLAMFCAVLFVCVTFCNFDTENQRIATFCAGTASGIIGLGFFFLAKKNGPSTF